LIKFLDCVENRRTPVPGSREGMASLRLTMAIVSAMAKGAPVELSQGEEG
jgi:predicted dehydrogenase